MANSNPSGRGGGDPGRPNREQAIDAARKEVHGDPKNKHLSSEQMEQLIGKRALEIQKYGS